MAFAISSEIRARVADEASEIERIFNLPDRWLGAEILRLTRLVRNGTEYANPYLPGSYNGLILWQALPELARRLGAPIDRNEARDPRFREAQGQAFRDIIGICITNVDTRLLDRDWPGEDRDPVGILFHNWCNGNPGAIALDRLVAPLDDSADPLARAIREVSKARGHAVVGAWAPYLQSRPEVQNVSSPDGMDGPG